LISFDVAGIPAPQGSKRPVLLGNGKTGMVESSKKVGPWRDAVRSDTAHAMNGAPPLAGPVSVTLAFRLARPASLPRRVGFPEKRPDLDKLIRSTLDGLTAGGAFGDDSQVIILFAGKVFGTPGCKITLEAMS
jgi:crossover junction endodeoxyribonuclease RusA